MELIDGWVFHRLPDGRLFPVLAGAKGGGAPAPATPSPEERRLQGIQATAAEEQLNVARDQKRENDALMPLLLQEYGITRTATPNTGLDAYNSQLQALQARRAATPTTIQLLDQQGGQGGQGGRGGQPVGEGRGGWIPRNVPNPQLAALDQQIADLQKNRPQDTISYAKAPNALADKRAEIEGLQLDRSLKALHGDLPVTLTLQKELQLGEQKLNERLGRQLGPGWETSTPGIQAKAEYDRMATALREGEQRDQLTTAEALSINRQGSRQSNQQNTQQGINYPSQSYASLLSGAGQGAGSALNYYGTLRNSSLAAKQMQGDETASYISGGIGAAGIAATVGIAI